GIGTINGLHNGILTGIGRRNTDQWVALVFVVGKRRCIPGRRQSTPRFLGLFFVVFFFRWEELFVVGLVKLKEETTIFSLRLNELGKSILSRVGLLGPILRG